MDPYQGGGGNSRGHKLGKFAEKNASRLIEADINPLIVRPKGKGVIAADALIHYLEDIK